MSRSSEPVSVPPPLPPWGWVIRVPRSRVGGGVFWQPGASTSQSVRGRRLGGRFTQTIAGGGGVDTVRNLELQSFL